MKKLGFVVLVLLGVLGCTSRYSSSGENLYLQARNGVALEIPPPLTRETISPFYNLPSQNSNAQVNITLKKITSMAS